MKTQHKLHRQAPSRLQNVVGLLFGIAAVYLLVRQWHTVDSSLHAARAARLPWLVGALGCMATTTLLAAAIYGTLALQHLRYMQTVAVEIAAGFVNRLFPSGLGSLGLHGVYLYKRRHTTAEATAVVSVNNLVGIMAHLSLLSLLVLLRPHTLRLLHIHVARMSVLWVILGTVLALLCVLALPQARLRVVSFLRNVLRSLRQVGVPSVMGAWVLAMVLTSLYTLILWCSGRAVDVHLTVSQMFIAFTIGMFSGTLIPLPGGLVGMEAGLIVGLTAYGVPTTQAGAVVVIFRLVTYWLPILPGIPALFWARRKQLV